ncbi:hypothetical protein [Ectobacillus sp. sgz5001026]|uniref:hypothetical protein n=1 Tax=Ectobacillus sp. sgz5001026 TaxID=3242473 RepID=UPI0036D32911
MVNDKKKQMLFNVIAAVIVVAAVIAIVLGNTYFKQKVHSDTVNAAPSSVQTQLVM